MNNFGADLSDISAKRASLPPGFRQPEIVINYSPYVLNNQLKVTLKHFRRLRRACLDNNHSHPFNRIRYTEYVYRLQK